MLEIVDFFQKESRYSKNLFINYYILIKYIKDSQEFLEDYTYVILETQKSSRICQPYFYYFTILLILEHIKLQKASKFPEFFWLLCIEQKNHTYFSRFGLQFMFFMPLTHYPSSPFLDYLGKWDYPCAILPKNNNIV